MIATESPPGAVVALLLLMVVVPSIALGGLYLAGLAVHQGLFWLVTIMFPVRDPSQMKLIACFPSAFLLFGAFQWVKSRAWKIRLPETVEAYLFQSRTVYYKNNRRYSPAEWDTYSAGL